MTGGDQVYTALPVQIVDIPEGVLVRRGNTQLRVRGSGIRSVTELIFILANSHGTSRLEIRELVLPRFPSFTEEMLDSLFDALISARLISATSDATGSVGREGDPAIGIFRWDWGVGNAKSLADANVLVFGINRITSCLVSALAASSISRVEVVDDPRLRSAAPDKGYTGIVRPHESLLGDHTWPSTMARPDIMVATSEAGNQDAFRQWNRVALDNAIPFLPVLLVDQNGQLGPLVQPGEGPCLECLRARQNANVPHPGLLRAVEETSHLAQDAIGFLPPMMDVLGSMAAIDVIKFLLNPGTFASVGYLTDVDFVTPSVVRRKVLKIPRCPVCANTTRQVSIRLSKGIPFPETSS